jgi:hypothetical protein
MGKKVSGSSEMMNISMGRLSQRPSRSILLGSLLTNGLLLLLLLLLLLRASPPRHPPMPTLRLLSPTLTCSHHAETVVLEPGTTYYLPPTTARTPLTVVLAVHLYRSSYAEGVLATWARRRCLRLVHSASDQTAAGFVLLQPLTFDASPHMDMLRPSLPRAHHVALPQHFSATMRTEALLPLALEQHPGAAWFFKCDDDAFVHGERLVLALLARNASEPSLVGHLSPLKFGAYRFLSGGAGYALSHAALRGLAPLLATCNNEASGFRYTTFEDVMVSKCARGVFGEGVVHDHAGFNWGRPEEMLATGTYSITHAQVPPITHHYIDPTRARALLSPIFPRRVLQVWPYTSAPPESSVDLNALLSAASSDGSLGGCSAPQLAEPSAAQLRNLQSCRIAAAAAGMEHVLLPARLGSLSATGLLQILLPAAVEQLALWEALYMHGGVSVPLGVRCELGDSGGGVLEALLAHADEEGAHAQARTVLEGSAAAGTQWVLGSARHGLTIGEGALAGAWAASHYHHSVFRSLAAAAAEVSAYIGGDLSLPGECNGVAEAENWEMARATRSAYVLGWKENPLKRLQGLGGLGG